MKYKLCAFLAHFNKRDREKEISQWCQKLHGIGQDLFEISCFQFFQKNTKKNCAKYCPSPKIGQIKKERYHYNSGGQLM